MLVTSHSGALCSGSADRDSVSIDFFQEGLRRGDACLCLVDDLGRARTPGARQPAPRGSAHPDLHPARDVCLSDGRFSANRMTEFLVDRAVRSADKGAPRLRVIVEMEWLGQQSRPSKDLLLYEASVEQVVSQVPVLVLCLYDLHSFGVEVLSRVLTGHHTVFVDGSMLVNPHYRVGGAQGAAALTDEEAGHPAGAQGRRAHQTTPDDPWHTLTGSELQIVAHVVAGLTNREVALLLVVSRHTVDAHLKHVFVKLGIHTRVELTVLALQHFDKD